MDKYQLEILPKYGILDINWRELREYKELLFFLAYKDIKVKYKQTVLGAAWAVLQPLLTMVIFTLLFNKLANISSDGIPYQTFSYSGLILWIYFSNILSQSSSSLIDNAQLLSKVYIPRIFIPLTPCIAGLADYSISTISYAALYGVMMMQGNFYNYQNVIVLTSAILLFIILMACIPRLGLITQKFELNNIIKSLYYLVILYVMVTPLMLYISNISSITIIKLFFIPYIVITTLMLASGMGFWLSSICVKYRDVKFILPFFIQLLMFVSPVVYSANSISGIYKLLLYINPLTGLITNQRACLTTLPIDYTSFVVSFIITLIIFVSGVLYLKQTEKHFADLV